KAKFGRAFVTTEQELRSHGCSHLPSSQLTPGSLPRWARTLGLYHSAEAFLHAPLCSKRGPCPPSKHKLGTVWPERRRCLVALCRVALVYCAPAQQQALRQQRHRLAGA